MKKSISLIILISLLFGCSSAPEPIYPSGEWQPVYTIDQTPKKIALHTTAPLVRLEKIDRTLKNGLQRIADSYNYQLHYQLDNDFTLTNASIAVSSPDLKVFLKELSKIYHVKIYQRNKVIYVR